MEFLFVRATDGTSEGFAGAFFKLLSERPDVRTRKELWRKFLGSVDKQAKLKRASREVYRTRHTAKLDSAILLSKKLSSKLRDTQHTIDMESTLLTSKRALELRNESRRLMLNALNLSEIKRRRLEHVAVIDRPTPSSRAIEIIDEYDDVPAPIMDQVDLSSLNDGAWISSTIIDDYLKSQGTPGVELLTSIDYQRINGARQGGAMSFVSRKILGRITAIPICER